MKNILPASLFVAIIFTSCYSVTSLSSMMGTSYEYDFGLVKTEDNETVIDSSSVMSFSDEKIDASFTVGNKSVSLRIKNKTSDVMKIIWDEASIVQYGESHKVMHSGVKYADRNSSLSATSIPPNAYIEDMALPSDNVYYREGYYSRYSSVSGGWEEHDLFITSDMNDEEFKATIMEMKGQELSLYLPIESNGSIIDYSFTFVVTDVKPIVTAN